MSEPTTFQAVSAIFGLTNLVVGAVYAVIGTTTISINGHRMPNWASACFRFLAPSLIMGVLLLVEKNAHTPEER
jgi:hypothetical protein